MVINSYVTSFKFYYFIIKLFCQCQNNDYLLLMCDKNGRVIIIIVIIIIDNLNG